MLSSLIYDSYLPVLEVWFKLHEIHWSLSCEKYKQDCFSTVFQLCTSHAYFLLRSERLIGFLSICHAAFSGISYFLSWLLIRLQTTNHLTPSKQIITFTRVQNSCVLRFILFNLSFCKVRKEISFLKIN